MTHFSVRSESFPLAQTFTISRGAKTTADVVVVELSRDGCVGRGECVPYPRYNESVAGTIDALESLRPQVEASLDLERHCNALCRPVRPAMPWTALWGSRS